ncbi:reverse transcriptase family protein [Ammonicoccus fulvus]|uniref:RNA-directed DNA polymerase n=1 Tax=Ammonicoccus fulvus TaxID=3138240 RepID=A0ABZ3FSC3_9ACTN
MPHDAVARAVALAFLRTDWTEPALRVAAREVLPEWPHRAVWVHRIVRGVLEVHPRPHGLRPRGLAAVLETLPVFDEARGRCRGAGVTWKPTQPTLTPTAMAARAWQVPALPDEAALSAWLRLPPGELAWLADNQHRHRRHPQGPLHPYRATWVPRRSGPPRLIEAPNSLLKRVQRRLATLPRALGAHDSAYGFVSGRSAVDHARLHVGQRRVLTVDLRDFFTSITARRVFGLLVAAGYPEAVAYLVAGLSTTATSIAALSGMPPGGRAEERYAQRARLREAHLPQGSPSSPAWSNAVCFSLDRRMAGLADSVGATYSRYADDLTFSGDRVPALNVVAAIVAAEGFALNPTKSRNLGRGRRQQVTGVVVNERPNVPREEYQKLRAILHDARRNGAAQANRAGVPDFAAHLAGRINWIRQLNPERGNRLAEAYARIDFTS